MPFAFSQLRPLNTGRVSSVDVPLGQYLSNAFSQGIHDSMFHSIMDMEELSLEREGTLLPPDEATKRYGIGSLKFDEPVYESEARVLRERKEAEMRRSFYLTSGNPDGLFSKRGIAGLGASMLGNILNPLDLSVNFLPVVGSEAAALRAAKAGRGIVTQSLERGLFTAESLGRLPAPSLVTSLVNAGVGNIVAEVPHLMSALESKEDYTVSESLTNVIAGTFLGAAIHLGMSQAIRIYDRLNPDTKETMLKEAVNQFLQGKDTDVTKYVEIDDATLRERVRFNEEVARLAATKNLSLEEVKEHVRQKYGERVVSAAYQNPETDEIRTGVNHWLIPIDDWIEKDGPPTRGFITDKDRFIEQPEAEAIQGISVSEQISDTSDPMFLLPEDRIIFDHLVENGATDAEAMVEVRRILRERADQFFFARPDIQEKLAQEKEAAVEKIIAEEKAKYDEEGRYKIERDAEIQRQIAEGKILTPEQKDTWNLSKKTVEEATTEVKDQIASLTQELEDELKAIPEESSKVTQKSALDKIDDVLKKLKIEGPNKGPVEGITGMPVILWNGAIEAIRLALKAGKSIAEAINAGILHLRKERGDFNLTEKHEAQFTKQVKAKLQPSTDLSRRKFIDIIGKVTGMGVTTPMGVVQALGEGVLKTSAKEAVKKTLLPNLSLSQIIALINNKSWEYFGEDLKSGKINPKRVEFIEKTRAFSSEEGFGNIPILEQMLNTNSKFQKLVTDNYLAHQDPLGRNQANEVFQLLQNEPLSKLEIQGEISKELVDQLNQLTQQVGAHIPEIMDAIRAAADAAESEIVEKAVKETAKVEKSAIDQALDCLLKNPMI